MSIIKKLGTREECMFGRMQEPFLETGYRIGYNATDCIRSVFQVHNETWNIWTHAFSLASWIFIGWLTFSRILPRVRRITDATLHHIAMFFLIAPTVASMASSVVFHTFRSIDERTYARLATIDFLLIVCAQVGTQVGQIFYAFWNRPSLLRKYSWAMTFLASVGIAYCSIPSLTHPAFRIIRTLVFVVIGCFGIVTTAHASWLERHDRSRVSLISKWIIVAHSLAGLAISLYIPRIPERFWPEVFDNHLQSHVLMHLFMMGTSYSYWWHYFINFRACFSSTSEKKKKKTL